MGEVQKNIRARELVVFNDTAQSLKCPVKHRGMSVSSTPQRQNSK